MQSLLLSLIRYFNVNAIISRIENNQFWKFHGGIHPPEQKFLTKDKPIKPLSLPSLLVIPIQQHIGVAGDILVSQGDKVLKGQPLTMPSVPMAVPVHAPTSGTIEKIALHTVAHPSGLSELCIFLTPDGEDTWRARDFVEDYKTLSKRDIISRISKAGISGMGGAGFPTHIKVDNKPDIDFLIINAAECEPYITADDLLIREQSATIIEGIKILQHLLEPKQILIGIEDNKPEAIKVLKSATEQLNNVQVCVVPTIYPTGGEKQLIKVLTGQEVQTGHLPIHHGIVMQNIATCFAIAEAVIEDIPLIRRVVTVSGQALEKPQNVWAAIGTQVKDLVASCQSNQAADKRHVIMGGPMMGFTLPTDTVPVVKTTNCILVPSTKELSTDTKEVECIRCGQCADVCPSKLLPQEMQWSAKAKDYDKLNDLNLFDCIDCGACAYVCPSHIPLVQYYRVAKAEIREKQLLDIKAEKAKARFEARKARLEREKIAREEKQRKAAEARKAAMNNKTAKGETAKSAVAAALARVKAKKAQQGLEETPEQTQVAQTDSVPAVDDQKSQVAAAIARAKAKKAAQKQQQNQELSQEKSQSTDANQANETIKSSTADDSAKDEQFVEKQTDKKAKVAAAVAKAKARKAKAKATQDGDLETQNNADDTANSTSDTSNSDLKQEDVKKEDDKKARVAAAVAKAKAKKAKANGTQESEPSEKPERNNTSERNNASEATTLSDSSKSSQVSENDNNDDEAKVNASKGDDKKARVAAAVAKAKAKQRAKKGQTEAVDNTSTSISTNESDGSSAKTLDDADKPKQLETPDNSDAQQPASSPQDDKKAKIAAAIAKAKAKKAKQASQQADTTDTQDASNADNEADNNNDKQAGSLESKSKETETVSAPDASLDEASLKKQRIAAAVAKAKAKKQQRTESQ